MGAGASVSAETELSAFKEMRAKFEALKEQGKADEEIYAELKTLYNTTTGAAPVANSEAEKPEVVPDAAAAPPEVANAAPAAETTPAAGEASVAAAATPEGEGGAAAATPAEGGAPPEATTTTE